MLWDIIIIVFTVKVCIGFPMCLSLCSSFLLKTMVLHMGHIWSTFLGLLLVKDSAAGKPQFLFHYKHLYFILIFLHYIFPGYRILDYQVFSFQHGKTACHSILTSNYYVKSMANWTVSSLKVICLLISEHIWEFSCVLYILWFHCDEHKCRFLFVFPIRISLGFFNLQIGILLVELAN